MIVQRPYRLLELILRLRSSKTLHSDGKKNSLSSVFETVLSETVFGPFLSVATPGEPRFAQKKLSFVQILGGEKLLEKCR